jgi:hypothetical protein
MVVPFLKHIFGRCFTKNHIFGAKKMKNKLFMPRKGKHPKSILFAFPRCRAQTNSTLLSILL